MSDVKCPKCPGTLARQNLVGVTIDQCDSCRGIFLDRGELEELLEAEHRWSRGHKTEYTGGRRRRATDEEDAYESTDYHGERRRRQASFLAEIFD
ncbi:TFIIB-type zinc ribbon-containing protein [Salinactinospora qingdaonensis]